MKTLLEELKSIYEVELPDAPVPSIQFVYSAINKANLTTDKKELLIKNLSTKSVKAIHTLLPKIENGTLTSSEIDKLELHWGFDEKNFLLSSQNIKEYIKDNFFQGSKYAINPNGVMKMLQHQKLRSDTNFIKDFTKNANIKIDSYQLYRFFPEGEAYDKLVEIYSNRFGVENLINYFGSYYAYNKIDIFNKNPELLTLLSDDIKEVALKRISDKTLQTILNDNSLSKDLLGNLLLSDNNRTVDAIKAILQNKTKLTDIQPIEDEFFGLSKPIEYIKNVSPNYKIIKSEVNNLQNNFTIDNATKTIDKIENNYGHTAAKIAAGLILGGLLLYGTYKKFGSKLKFKKK